ncbi:MAG TPA: protein kinase [Gemmatimonadaceae bacterium]|nr:protein kinase [Gemmatimonadaceae bacterium]
MDLRDELQRTLGDAYALERELGGGGMSRVFVAEERSLRRKVVVKVLPPELTAGVNVERFNREILVAAKLQHPHIVPVLAAGEMNGLPYYTMPFVEGESLRVRLARANALSITDAVGVLRDVAKALAFAHKRGIVHRDIKPDNVLITGGSATVTDFGIAKAISASRTAGAGATLTQVGTSIGTPSYMSPEQAAGDPDTDHRTDIYSFGCMAYELLAGRPPFTEKTPRKLLAAHMGEKPAPVAELRSDTPVELAELVMRCLEKEADSRPQHASDLVHVLETVTSGGTQPAMPAVLLGGRGMFRKALLLYAAAFVAVAILAKAAIVGIGLPDWVFPGSLIVMALGLPVILWTGYVQRVTRQALTATPTYTPGGTPSVAQGTMATLAIKAAPHVSWHRTARGVAYALGTFVVIVAAFMVMRAVGIGPAASLLAAGKISQKDPILLADFRISNADSALGRVASDAVRQGLAESSVITLVSPATVAAALQRAQRPASSSLDLQLARDIALRQGVKAIIDGEVAGAAGGYLVTLRLVSTDSLVPLTMLTASGQGPQGFIDAVDKVTRTFRAKAGESLRRVQRAPPLGDVTTGSLDALRKYSEAYRANSFEAMYVKAAALAREAVGIDSGFAMAWRLLGTSMSNAGMQRAPIDSAFEQAYRLRGRLSERERVFVTGSYYTNTRHRDREKAIAAWEALMAMGDAEAIRVASNYLGLEFESRREHARADSMFAAGIRADASGNFPYTNRIIALLNAGRLAEAREAAQVAARRFPALASAQQRQRDLLYHEGRLDQLRRQLDSIETAGNPAMRSWALAGKAAMALSDGRLAEWRRLNARQRATDSARGVAPNRLLGAAVLARLDAVARGSGASVAEGLDAALVQTPLRSMADVDRPYLQVTSAYATSGRRDRARAILAEYAAAVTDTALRRVQQPEYHNALGEVLLAERRPTEAIGEFRQADVLPDGPATSCTICLPWNLARSFDAASQPDSAIAMYEEYLSTPYYQRFQAPLDPVALPFIHRRLGELYEAKRNAAKAAEHYRAFIDLWKNADAELQPRVAEARRRLAKLTPVEKPH